jgi:hypothetical protein
MLKQADVLDDDTDTNTSEVTRSFYHRSALGSVKVTSDHSTRARAARRGRLRKHRYIFGSAVAVTAMMLTLLIAVDWVTALLTGTAFVCAQTSPALLKGVAVVCSRRGGDGRTGDQR